MHVLPASGCWMELSVSFFSALCFLWDFARWFIKALERFVKSEIKFLVVFISEICESVLLICTLKSSWNGISCSMCGIWFLTLNVSSLWKLFGCRAVVIFDACITCINVLSGAVSSSCASSEPDKLSTFSCLLFVFPFCVGGSLDVSKENNKTLHFGLKLLRISSLWWISDFLKASKEISFN